MTARPRRPGGRRRVPGDVAPPLLVGVDVGATKVVAALVDAYGRAVRHSGRSIHPNAGAESVLREAVDAVRRVVRPGDLPFEGIGIGVAGQVDLATGSVRYAPNLGWQDVALGPTFEAEFGVPVAIANDVRAATAGEWRFGAGQGETNLFGLFVGTGVGGSAVVDGRLLKGAVNATGEVGHMVVVAGGRPCHCPSRGCLEAYVGGWAIAERAREAVRADPGAGDALARAAGGVDRVSAETLSALARSGDPFARRLEAETAGFLAAGVVGIVNAFNPSLVILGGGVIEGWPELVPFVADEVKTRCQPPAAGAVRCARASLGHDAIVLGAASLAREQLRVGARRAAPVP